MKRLASSLIPAQWHDRARSIYLWCHEKRRRIGAPFARRGRVGAGSYIEPSAHILSWRAVRIGRNCVIGGGTTFNINNDSRQDRIVIGDFSYVARFTFFNSGELIQLGDYTLIGPGCRFLGADHIYSDPFKPYIATGMQERGKIVLNANCWLGADVTIMGPVTVGHGSVVGAGAMVTRDMPPFSLSIGRPAKVVKRFDMSSNAWIAVENFTPDMEAMLPDETAYLAILRAASPSIAMPYAAAGPARGDLA